MLCLALGHIPAGAVRGMMATIALYLEGSHL